MISVMADIIPYLILLCGIALLLLCAYTSLRWLDAALRYAALVFCCNFILEFDFAVHYDEMSITNYIGAVITVSLLYQLPLALWGAALAVAIPFTSGSGRLGHTARAILTRAERHRVMLLRSLCFVPLAVALLCVQRFALETPLREVSIYAWTIYAAALVIILPELLPLLRRLRGRAFSQDDAP